LQCAQGEKKTFFIARFFWKLVWQNREDEKGYKQWLGEENKQKNAQQSNCE